MKFTNLSLAACLLATTLIPLGGCAQLGLVAPTSPANIATDLAALKTDATATITGLQGILPVLTKLAPNSPVLAKINADLAKAASDLPVLNGFNNLADAKGTAQEITTLVQDVLTQAASLPIIPEPYSGVIAAAGVLLPIILQDVGLPAPASALAPKFGVTPLTPDQASKALNLSARGEI